MRLTIKTVVAALAGLALTASAANASLIAYWNFNTGNTGTPLMEWPGPIAADQGTGSIVMTGWTGDTSAFAGSTINVLNADVAGGSLSLVNSTGNTSYIQANFSMTGLQDLIVTFATRGTSTGYDTGTWSYSTDGSTYTNFGPNTASRVTTYALATVDFTGVAGLANAASVSLRYTLDGCTTASGNNRIDNLQLNATPIPEPATLALLGCGALFLRRRRA